MREHFDQARNVDHFRQIYDREYLELKLLERKGQLQDRLFNLMISEPNLDRIMELSPYTNVRKEIDEFLEEQVSPVSSLRYPFQRDIMDGSLTTFITDLNVRGRSAEIVRAF